MTEQTRIEFSDEEKVIIRLLQEDLPLVSRPFDVMAAKIGWTGQQLMEQIKKMRQEKKSLARIRTLVRQREMQAAK